MQAKPKKGHKVLTNAASAPVPDAPLIDLPEPTSDQRERLTVIFNAVRTFDSKAIIRGYRATGRRR
jgi:hypothetical protein